MLTNQLITIALTFASATPIPASGLPKGCGWECIPGLEFGGQEGEDIVADYPIVGVSSHHPAAVEGVAMGVAIAVPGLATGQWVFDTSLGSLPFEVGMERFAPRSWGVTGSASAADFEAVCLYDEGTLSCVGEMTFDGADATLSLEILIDITSAGFLDS